MTTLDFPFGAAYEPTTSTLRFPTEPRDTASAHTLVELTRTPGLVVAPRFTRDVTGAWTFTGAWQVAHARSGMAVSAAFTAGLGHARDAAALLGELELDWTRPCDELRLTEPEVRRALIAQHARLRAAVGDERPVYLTSSSFRQTPPLYLVYDADAGPGWSDAEVAVESWNAAADHLEAIDWPDAVIVRDEQPWWLMHCATKACQQPLHDDGPAWEPMRHLLTDTAAELGWRRLDQRRWLCARCSHDFREIPARGL